MRSNYYKNDNNSANITLNDCELNFLSNFVDFLPKVILNNKHVLTSIILNPSTRKEVINNILSNNHSITEYLTSARASTFVGSELVGNPNTSIIDVLRKLIIKDHHKNYEDYVIIITLLALNPNTPTTVLEKIAKNEDCDIRKMVTYNPQIPTHILEELANDEDNYICKLAKDNLNSSANKSRQISKNNINNKLKQESAISKQNIFSQNREVRSSIATNIDTSASILEQLSAYESYLIEQSEANISGISIIQEEGQLPIDEDRLVTHKILQNPNCTHNIKTTIFKNFAKLKTPSFCRLALFLSEYAESEELAANYNSTSWLERYAIAQNSKTPKNTLEKLAQDGNRIVRATAKESLEKYY